MQRRCKGRCPCGGRTSKSKKDRTFEANVNFEADKGLLEEDRMITMILDAYVDFKHLDKNNDSRLNFEEFKIPYANISDESVVANVFKKFDQVFKKIMRQLHDSFY